VKREKEKKNEEEKRLVREDFMRENMKKNKNKKPKSFSFYVETLEREIPLLLFCSGAHDQAWSQKFNLGWTLFDLKF
jgi:hypothetical protein